VTEPGRPEDRPPAPGVADLQPGDEEASAVAGGTAQAVPDEAGAGRAGPDERDDTTGSPPATGRDELAPGRALVDADQPEVEPNEPA
jgi:hypothetical protein